VSFAQQPAKPCSEPQHKQLDFWLGEWDVSWPGDNGAVVHGHNSIHRTLDGCVVEEHFTGGNAMALRGMSVSMFDARSGRWKQTWVDNQGSYLDFTGGFAGGQMVFEREFARDGKHIRQRMVFKNIRGNEFDWSWERSEDGGKTWQVQWPIHYKRAS
jgi:hypothetical protein